MTCSFAVPWSTRIIFSLLLPSSVAAIYYYSLLKYPLYHSKCLLARGKGYIFGNCIHKYISFFQLVQIGFCILKATFFARKGLQVSKCVSFEEAKNASVLKTISHPSLSCTYRLYWPNFVQKCTSIMFEKFSFFKYTCKHF